MKCRLPEGWKEVKLGEVSRYINNKVTIDDCKINSYISTTNMVANKGGIMETDKLPKTKTVNSFRINDILISNIRPYFKKIWFAQFNGTSSSDILIIRSNDELYAKFLYYILSNDQFFKYATKTAKGTKMPRGDREAIMQYKIPLIGLWEQKAIANTLSALDDKIELNNKINKNLEEQAQALFKRWFIDFEFPNEEGNPYKSSGGEMVESELGKIPLGWEVTKLHKIADLTMGLSPKSPSYNFDKIGIPLLNGAADFKNGLINTKRYTSAPKRVCKKGDLVFCIRGTIGNITFADKEYCIGRGVASITPQKDVFKGLIFYSLLSSIENLTSKASGSVILNLTKKDINNMNLKSGSNF